MGIGLGGGRSEGLGYDLVGTGIGDSGVRGSFFFGVISWVVVYCENGVG